MVSNSFFVILRNRFSFCVTGGEKNKYNPIVWPHKRFIRQLCHVSATPRVIPGVRNSSDYSFFFFFIDFTLPQSLTIVRFRVYLFRSPL